MSSVRITKRRVGYGSGRTFVAQAGAPAENKACHRRGLLHSVRQSRDRAIAEPSVDFGGRAGFDGRHAVKTGRVGGGCEQSRSAATARGDRWTWKGRRQHEKEGVAMK